MVCDAERFLENYGDEIIRALGPACHVVSWAGSADHARCLRMKVAVWTSGAQGTSRRRATSGSWSWSVGLRGKSGPGDAEYSAGDLQPATKVNETTIERGEPT